MGVPVLWGCGAHVALLSFLGGRHMARVRLGQMLLDEGRISEIQLKSAVAHQDRWNTRIGEALVALGYLSERVMLSALARQLAVPLVELGDRRIPRAVLNLVPLSIIRRRHLIPLGLLQQDHHRGPLLVAVSDPSDLASLDEVAFAAGFPVKAVLASQADVDRAIDRHFEGLAAGQPRALDLPPDPGPITLIKRGQKN